MKIYKIIALAFTILTTILQTVTQFVTEAITMTKILGFIILMQDTIIPNGADLSRLMTRLILILQRLMD